MTEYVKKQDIIEAINKASLEEWYETRQTSAVAFRILEKLEEMETISLNVKPPVIDASEEELKAFNTINANSYQAGKRKMNMEVIAQKMLGIGPDDGPLFTLACDYWGTRGGGCKDCPLRSKCEDINVEAWLKQEVEE